MSDPFHFHAGSVPLLVSMPHVGTEIPGELLEQMTPAAAVRADTDWHVDRLYDFAEALGASTLGARFSRYVIDLNRDPEDRPLYAGANNTELCPTSTFDEEPLYGPGLEPDGYEVERRRERYWRPYHARLQEELARLHAKHGVALLWEGHSIRSEVPRFFSGRLPDLNFGTAGGTSAAPDLMDRIGGVAESAGGFSHVIDGRFKGGYITRTYGRPEQGIHAIQLELAQITYMDETPPFAYRPERAAKLKAVLRLLLEAALAWSEKRRAA